MGPACGDAHRQRLRLHREPPRWSLRDGVRAARPRHRVSPLPSLPPADTRQGGAVPSEPAAGTLEELQAQLDRFVEYYNEIRPHRARGRIPPRSAFDSRDKAHPLRDPILAGAETRIRHDRVDGAGKVTLRYRSTLHHIGLGRAYKGLRVVLLVDGLHIRVLSEDGELLRELTLDPTRIYQPTGKPRWRRRVSTMS
jgi:hypothetical protein